MFTNFPFKLPQRIENSPKHIYQSRGKDKFPFYVKAPMVLLGLVLFFYILDLLEDVLIPICYAFLLSILLNPLVNKMISKGMNRILAISLAILLSVIVFLGLLTLIGHQLANFGDLLPELSAKSDKIINDIQIWVRRTFGMPIKKQQAILNDGIENMKEYALTALLTITDIIGIFVLLPIYVFLILYYKPMFINFFYEVFGYKNGNKVSEVLTETKGAIQSYIFGLLLETGIVAVLNVVALLILGVDYAILIGLLGALLNLIPYIGGMVAIALPVAISIVTNDPINYTTPILIVVAYTVIQFIDNNIIVPKVVSSKVEVNAFVSIIIVLLGGAIWGVSGMFLSIPFVAILKIIFDRIQELKPWGMILGTAMNPDFSLEDIGNEQAEEKSILNVEDHIDEISLKDFKNLELDPDAEKDQNPPT